MRRNPTLAIRPATALARAGAAWSPALPAAGRPLQAADEAADARADVQPARAIAARAQASWLVVLGANGRGDGKGLAGASNWRDTDVHAFFFTVVSGAER